MAISHRKFVKFRWRETALMLTLHHFQCPVCKNTTTCNTTTTEMFTAQLSFKPSQSFLGKMRRLCLISCLSGHLTKLRSGKSSWKCPPVSLVPQKLAWRLLLHSVPDGPPLPGAGLQDQQVAEVNVSRHHLQTASRGSIYDRFILLSRRRGSVLVISVLTNGPCYDRWPDVDRCFSFNPSQVLIIGF